MIAGYFDPEAFRAIKVLAAQQDVPVDVLIHEAFAALFKRLKQPVPSPILKRLKERLPPKLIP